MLNLNQLQLVTAADASLTGNEDRQLQDVERVANTAFAALDRLRTMALKPARACALDEHVMSLWTEELGA